MPKLDVHNMKGEVVGSVELNPSIFDVEINEHAVYTVVKNILANRRQGTQSAKTRAEVRGGGRKPWRQKGTGRARQGSIRSPQWKGGGIVFAPKPRDYSYTTPKKIKRLALKSCLSSKFKDSELVIVDELKLDSIKTKDFKAALKALDAMKALVVLDRVDANVILSARNLEGVCTTQVGTLNVYDILKHDKLIITKEALNKLEEVYA